MTTGDVAEPGSDIELVGRNPRFLEAVDIARRAAPTTSSVLVRGPSGSGKDVLARYVHALSPRNGQPFFVMNAAALPETLVERELFGHDRGAFTGADRASKGAFERAHGGTLFLDEIGDLSLAAQAKILTVIETGEIMRVGGSRCHVDVRLVTATHRDLAAMVRQGTFREDLLYRLRVIEVTLPSLAERAEDILDLAGHFLGGFRRPDGERVSGLSPLAAEALTAYSWPGNIRELRNVIERAVVLDRDGLVDLDDLPAEIREAVASRGSGARDSAALFTLPWTEARKRFDREYFARALARNGGHVIETARQTGVDRKTISNKIREHGLKDE